MILMSVLCTLSFRRMATFAKHMGVLFDPRSGLACFKDINFPIFICICPMLCLDIVMID
jgi:hypothetical protein